MSKIQNYSLIYTLLILGLGMIHISFALIGLVCYASPVILFQKHHDKTFCKKYCPRASLLQKVFSRIGLKRKMPKWLNTQNVKSFFAYYMVSNFFFAIMSTLAVYFGRIEAMDHLRLFMAFESPIALPQILNFDLPMFMIHYSYRVYSMIFSSILIGFVLGFLYAPRTWCVVCPVNTLSVPKALKV
jgi:hypothetical protein